MSERAALLILDDSERSTDLFYRTRFQIGSPVIYLETESRKTLLIGDLEYGRAGQEACVDEVISATPYEERLRAAGEPVRIISVLDLFLKERGIRELQVPGAFPFVLADRLRALGYELKARDEPIFPERAVKTEAELRAIAKLQGQAEAAMSLAIELLQKSEVRGDRLLLEGAPLTSERVRLEMQKLLLDVACEAPRIIVAGGDQGVDPHSRGTGPLPAHQTIIIDVFPRSMESGYWGDMTRTVVRGRASEEVRRMYRDVRDAQDLALSRLAPGVDAKEIHEAVCAHFRERGWVNGERDGRKTGYIHSTGHGIGLDIHEAPRIGRLSTPLQAGNVLTVEPGLYYPGIGAVRLEDVAVVTPEGHRNLNNFPRQLEV